MERNNNETVCKTMKEEIVVIVDKDPLYCGKSPSRISGIFATRCPHNAAFFLLCHWIDTGMAVHYCCVDQGFPPYCVYWFNACTYDCGTTKAGDKESKF